MSKYRLPPPGPSNPIDDIRHYVANQLGGDIVTMKGGEKPNLSLTSRILCDLLGKYANGTYTYQHTQSFNPEIARGLKQKVQETVRSGAAIETLEGLVRTFMSVTDSYAVETGQPGRTRREIQKLRRALKAKARK